MTELTVADQAATLFEQVALADEFPDFLTTVAYALIDYPARRLARPKAVQDRKFWSVSWLVAVILRF